mmetsp:Transcript_8649/g.32559  ORF Transcript_8649/g.32559 Transcript_8649/m.32559 type:complete len:1264 (+) Transcript_8649:49-3840(+)
MSSKAADRLEREALKADLQRLEETLTSGVDDTFFQDEDRFRALIHIIDVLGAETGVDAGASTSLEDNAAYVGLQEQLRVVDGVIEEIMTRHYQQLNSSVQSMSHAARQFDDIEGGVRELREMVDKCKIALQGELQRTSVAELWLRKSEAQKLVDMLDKIQLLREAPVRFDTLTAQRCYFSASVLFQRALNTMFDEDLSGVEGLTRIRDKLMERKETILDGLVLEILKVLYLETGDGIPSLLAADALQRQKERRRRRRRGNWEVSSMRSGGSRSNWDVSSMRSGRSRSSDMNPAARSVSPAGGRNWEVSSARSGWSRASESTTASTVVSSPTTVVKETGLGCAMESPVLGSQDPLDVSAATEEAELALCGVRQQSRGRSLLVPSSSPDKDPVLFLKLLCRALARLRLGADARARVREVMQQSLDGVRVRALKMFAEAELKWSTLQMLPEVPKDAKRLATYLRYLFNAFGAVLRGHLVFFGMLSRAEALEEDGEPGGPTSRSVAARVLSDPDWRCVKELWGAMSNYLSHQIWPYLQPLDPQVAKAATDSLPTATRQVEGDSTATGWRVQMRDFLQQKNRTTKRESFGLHHTDTTGGIFGLGTDDGHEAGAGLEDPAVHMLDVEDLVLAKPRREHAVPVLQVVEDFTGKVETSFLAIHQQRENFLLGLVSDSNGPATVEEDAEGTEASGPLLVMRSRSRSISLDDLRSLKGLLKALDNEIIEFVRKEVLPPLLKATSDRIDLAFAGAILALPLQVEISGSVRSEASRLKSSVTPIHSVVRSYEALKDLFQISIQIQSESGNTTIAESAEDVVFDVLRKLRGSVDALTRKPYLFETPKESEKLSSSSLCDARSRYCAHAQLAQRLAESDPAFREYVERYQRYELTSRVKDASGVNGDTSNGSSSHLAAPASYRADAPDRSEAVGASFEREKQSAVWQDLWQRDAREIPCPFPKGIEHANKAFGGDAQYIRRLQSLAALAYASDWFGAKIMRTSNLPQFSGGSDSRQRLSQLGGEFQPLSSVGGVDGAAKDPRSALNSLFKRAAKECAKLSTEILCILRLEIMLVCFYRIQQIPAQALKFISVDSKDVSSDGDVEKDLVPAVLLERELREIFMSLAPSKARLDFREASEILAISKYFPETLAAALLGSLPLLIPRAFTHLLSSLAKAPEEVVSYLHTCARHLEVAVNALKPVSILTENSFDQANEYVRLMSVSLQELEEYIVSHRWRYSRDEYFTLWSVVYRKRNKGLGLATSRERDLDKRFQHIYGN